jgi:hypothetical protein
MDYLTKRALLRICELFQRLDRPARIWVLSRLAADHEEMLREERKAS